MQTLLIVEDEKMIRKGIAVMASRSATSIDRIIECRNGIEALEILEKQKIDTIFTDIRMPKMDGITLLNTLSQYEEKPEIVVISGYDDFSYAVEALKCGAREYILKPVNREDIYKIRNITNNNQKAYLFGAILYSIEILFTLLYIFKRIIQ